MLRRDTVDDNLFKVLQLLMKIEELGSFQLVGGTAIALIIGHRKSIDIDLFSNEKLNLLKVGRSITSALGKDVEFNVADDNINAIIDGVRVEIYHDWSIPFKQLPTIQEGIRISALEDLAAFKLSAMVGRREKKDYIDLFFLFKYLSPESVLNDFKNYEPLLSDKSILFALMEVDSAIENKSVMPDMLVDFSWENIKETFHRIARDHLKKIK